MKVGIVGGGIIGRLMSFLLYQNQWQVTLFDQMGKNNCSFAASGLLTPVSELEKSDITIFKLGIESLKQYWPILLSQISDSSTPIYFRNKGSLLLAHSHDQTELTHYIQIITGKLQHNNFYNYLSPREIKKLEPKLPCSHHGYYFPDEGQIDNQSALNALKKFLVSRINYLDNQSVDEIRPGEISSNSMVHRFDLVLDCRGLAAKPTLPTLRGVRGELIWLHAPEVSITRPIRLLHPRYRLYIVPRPHHTYLLGSTEIESEDNSAISVRTTLELLTAAYSFQAQFAEARLIKTVTACRPTFMNNLPKIQYTHGLISINGLYRHGFLIAPSLAYEVMRFINQGLSSLHYRHLWEAL